MRILHVDDEPDIREVVKLSLGLDPSFSVRSCASGADAIAAAEEWYPDIVLCDVMMPVMDGPATLARLRESPQTVDTPIIFMTARAQTREIEHLRSLGAAGIIAKPFDPMTLGDAIRQQLQATAIAASRERFLKRTQTDVTRLTEHMAILSDDPKSPRALEEIKTIAHGLAGTGGIFGLEELSCVASTLEQAVIDEIAGEGMSGAVMQQLDAVIKHLIHPA